MGNVNRKINRKLLELRDDLVNYFSVVDNVYIVPHKNMDFDAIGAAAAMAELALQNNKQTFIITDDSEELMEVNLKKIYNKLKLRYNFITTCELGIHRIDKDRELVMIVDVNRSFLIPIHDMLPTFSNIVILDHHKTDKYTVDASSSFIESDMSSACEIAYNVLKKFKIKPDAELAMCLYAGIYLDTRRLGRLNEYICLTVAQLLRLGASHEETKKLFVKTDFSLDREEKRLINDLLDNTIITNKKFAVSLNNLAHNLLYTREVLSKTADELIENYDVEASFVMGFIDRKELGEGHNNIVHISSRSSSFDVSVIMRMMGGGGRCDAAAADFIVNDIRRIKNILLRILEQYSNSNEATQEEMKKLVLLPPGIKKI